MQIVLDAIEGDLATKADFAVFQAQIDNRLSRFESHMGHFESRIESRFDHFEEKLEEKMDRRFIEYEFRILTRMGIMMASMLSIAIAVLTWLTKT